MIHYVRRVFVTSGLESLQLQTTHNCKKHRGYDSAGNLASDPLRGQTLSYTILSLPCSISTTSDEADYSYLAADAANRWRFSGKELQTTAGVNLLDFGARLYDDRLCRWTTRDPMSEKYYGFSPYNYCAGDPVNYTDTDGRDAVFVTFKGYNIESAGMKNPGLGHAGILLINNKTGLTKYYEYGRYDRENIGVTRSYAILNVVIGEVMCPPKFFCLTFGVHVSIGQPHLTK